MTSNRIKEYRNRAGLTLAQVAQALGVSRQAVAHLEDGDYLYGPRLDTARRLAAALGATVDDVFPAVDGPGRGTQIIEKDRADVDAASGAVPR